MVPTKGSIAASTALELFVLLVVKEKRVVLRKDTLSKGSKLADIETDQCSKSLHSYREHPVQEHQLQATEMALSLVVANPTLR